MSTLLAHVAAGTAIYLCRHRLVEAHPWSLPLLVFLAVMPDCDYLLLWIWGLKPDIRLSHSLVFCLGVSAVVWGLTARWHQTALGFPTLLTMGAASNSHLVLDLLVGVHGLPLFWPWSAREIASPLGVLPSAIHTRNFTNPYLWRNCLIEGGVLLPCLAAMVVLARKIPLRRVLPKALWLLPVWGMSLSWSLSLQR